MKQRRVEVKSFQIWKDDYQTMTWLECTAVPPGNKLIDKLKSKVCTNYMDGLEILDHWSCFFIKIPLKMMSEQNVLMTDQV